METEVLLQILVELKALNKTLSVLACFEVFSDATKRNAVDSAKILSELKDWTYKARVEPVDTRWSYP